MKYTICIILLFMTGCSETQSGLAFIAVQHTGKGIIHNDPCKTLYREDGIAVTTPTNFKITPVEAIKIAKDHLGYSCHNKLGTEIFSDDNSYHIVRLGVLQDAIIINGITGAIESQGFMRTE